MPRVAATGRRRVSGEVVLVSGQPVDVSGSFVYTSIEATVASGTPVGISGQVVKISGETIYLESGTGPILAKVSGETVQLASGTGPISVSGQPIKISGEKVFVITESGDYVVVSGEVVAKVSGESLVVTSGEVRALISGDVVQISGQVVDFKAPTTIKTSGLFTVTGASGGANLYSGAVVSVTVKALSSNSGDIYVGGSTHKPYSGYGFLLEPGEAINVDVDNFGEVWVFAAVSGDKVTYLGIY